MSIAPYLKEIGRGKDGARALSRTQSQDLMARLLDDQISDLEKGGFALAMRIKGETAEELAGFMDAVLPRMLPLASPTPAVLLPCYNGARKLPALTALLALLLAREGVPVLLHGFTRDATRVTSAQVLEALDLAPVDSAEAVQARWAAGQPAYLPLEVLHPSLAKLLALRAVLGLRNPGHTLAKLLPAVPGALRVVNHTHPEYADSLSDYLTLSEATAVLLRGTEGEPVADPRRLPALKCFVRGQLDEAFSVPAQAGSLLAVPSLPTPEPEATALAIRAMLAGELPVPEPILRQRDALLALRQTLAN